MELIHSHNDKNNATGLRPSWRQSVLMFVNRYAESFEIIARSGNMFGGDTIPVNRSSAKTRFDGITSNEIMRVQRQVNEITRTVAQLNDQISMLASQTSATSTGRSANKKGKKSTRPTDIGINRYRTLEGKA